MSARCSACGQALPRDLETIIADFQRRYPPQAPEAGPTTLPQPKESA